jgi:hypothetical protein
MKKKGIRKAFIRGNDGKKHEFDMPRETAEKVLRLQKLILEERKERAKKK